MTKIKGSAPTPGRIKPGDQVTLQTNFEVLAPLEKGPVKVREVRTLLFNKQELQQFNNDKEYPTGVHRSTRPLTLPEHAARGQYTIRTTVQPLVDGKKSGDKSTAFFVVE